MYLQELRKRDCAHTHWPDNTPHSDAQLTLWFDELDATLNSWHEAHDVFAAYQPPDSDVVNLKAYDGFSFLVRKALGERCLEVGTYPSYVLAYALLRVWIANRNLERKAREQRP